MSPPQLSIWVPVLSALAGALIASISPVVVGIINSRAESRRERLRLAVQVALEDHKHMLAIGQARSNITGVPVGVAPIAAVLAYHVEVFELYEAARKIKPSDLVALRARAKEAFEALKEEATATAEGTT